MEPRPQGHVLASQSLPDLLAVPVLHPEGEYSGLSPRGQKYLHPRQAAQTLPNMADQLGFLGSDVLHPLVLDKAQSLQQSGDTGHVVGPRLQPVREEVGHRLAHGFAARPPLQQGGRVPAAQQQAGALGPVQPLMPRHCHKGRPQPLKVQGQTAGGLGGINNQGHPSGPAKGGDLGHGQDKAKDIGYMGTNR